MAALDPPVPVAHVADSDIPALIRDNGWQDARRLPGLLETHPCPALVFTTLRPEERIEAARRAQEAGYTIRYKLKPITPIRDWRNEVQEMIALLLARTRPDNVGLCTIAWVTGEELEACLGPYILDPEALRAVRDSAEQI